MVKRSGTLFSGLSSKLLSKDQGLFHYFYLLHFGLFILGLICIILDFNGFFRNSFYPLEMSIIIFSTSSVYFLYKGFNNAAVNLVNFLPVPIYFLLESPSMAIFPPLHSHFLHVRLLSLGCVFLLVFAKKISQLYIYMLVSILSLFYHLYITNQITNSFKLFWPTQELLINPLFLYLIIAGIVLVIFNLFHSELKKREEKIEEKNMTYRNVFNNVPFGIINILIERDEYGEKSGLTIEHINASFENYFNLKNSEVRGKSAAVIFPEIFKDEVDWQDLFLNGGKIRNEIYLSQYEQWFRVIGIKPNKKHIIGIFENITDYKHAIKELDKNRYRYKLLLETIPDIFFVIDKDGTYIDYVAKDEEGFKFSPEEIIGSTIYEVGYSSKMVKQVHKSIQAVIKTDVIETIEYVLEVTGKGSCFFEMRMVKLSENSVMAISRDITKQKFAQQKIEEARRKAEEADQLKAAFLQNISHEVRTPLNAILGFSNVLLMDDEIASNEKRNYLQLIIRNGQILLHVFNDTIKLSRIQSGMMTVEKKIVYLNNTMTDLFRQFLYEKEQIGKDHLKLFLTKGNENARFSVCVDGQKIKDILESLLDNAVKFTKEGEINFGYRIINGGLLEFFVTDTGIGIPENKFEEIFERFHQLDSGMTREYGGTGIGLSLARDFANLLGTKLEVKSKEGKGSTFSFIIQAEASEGHLKII